MAAQTTTYHVRWWTIPVAVVAILVVLGVGMTQILPATSRALDSHLAAAIMVFAVLVFIGSLTVFFTGLLSADEHGAFGDVY